MRRLSKTRAAQLLWITLMGAAALLFRAKKGDAAFMNAAAERFADPMKTLLGSISYGVKWSVMELVIALVILAAAVFLGFAAVRLFRERERRREIAFSTLLTALCAVLTVAVAADWLWGVYYYADGLQERSGIYAEDISLEELILVTRYAAAHLNAAAEDVARDENGLFAVTREEIFTDAAAVYDNISRDMPCLAYDDRAPKPVRFSAVMSRLRLTGVYFSYTGEANVNVASPACMLPSTIAHELAHQRGIASEKECNFAAVLASTTAQSPAYRYSGWLLAYIHLGNALYSADTTAWQSIRATLSEEVLLDLAANNAYWKPYRETVLSEGYQSLYDGYLKNYGESDGVKSYGMVVDLLAVYYRDAARAACKILGEELS